MKMMKMMMLAGLGILLAGNVMAQDVSQKKQKTPEEKARSQADKMKEMVGLTDEQYKQVYDLSLTIANKREVIKNTPLTEDDRRAQLKALHQEKKDGLAKILTADQQATLKKKREEMKAKWHDKKKSGGGATPPSNK